ncbi:hypothetical protein [Candidatus Karelsulcia muelleri]
MRTLRISDQNLIRRKKLKQLKPRNINPYPYEEYNIQEILITKTRKRLLLLVDFLK